MELHNHLFAMSRLFAKANPWALAAVSLLATGWATSGCAGTADTSESMSSEPAPSKPAPRAGEGVTVTLQTKGITLTSEQAKTLKNAYSVTPHLSLDQARAVIGPVIDPVDAEDAEDSLKSGSDTSIGDCSYIDLYGDSDGFYRFNQAVHDGEAEFGDITISTDGGFSSEDNHVPRGSYQHYEGTLLETGIFATGTTMDGWMFTSTGSFCTGELFAKWH